GWPIPVRQRSEVSPGRSRKRRARTGSDGTLPSAPNTSSTGSLTESSGLLRIVSHPLRHYGRNKFRGGRKDGGAMQKRILVVEDNDLNRKLFCDVLQAGGFAVEPVADGNDCVERARSFFPNLVVMD